MKKAVNRILLPGVLSLVGLLLPSQVSAHVKVSPNQALTGEFMTFTVSVPNEKNVPTVALKLEIPKGLQYVTPTVKPGWTIESEKTGSGEDAVVTSISWTGGNIPVGQRDDFTFSAKLPDSPTELQWKAFQTYEGGLVVSWDLPENETSHHSDSSNSGPFSTTKVTSESTDAVSNPANTNKDNTLQDNASTIALIALGLSIVSLTLVLSRRKQ